MPIDVQRAGDLADPTANHPVFLRVGGGGAWKNIRLRRKLADAIEWRVAIEPLPLLAVPEVIGAVRPAAAGKRAKAVRGISQRGIGADESSIGPAFVPLRAGVGPIRHRIGDDGHVVRSADESGEGCGIAEIIISRTGVDDEIDEGSN